ncbi:Translation initiation factor [Aspergillus sclerotialis]|uniref:Translation initiation factor n=1 Tax=Aspergillus sclerotialis TaxID=2070753 RepID=A0A3A2ZRI4_9EURO|nr:Translation initiation factor [Aspergillus sclerotialis]
MRPVPELSITGDDIIIELEPESPTSSQSSDSSSSRESQVALRKELYRQFIMSLRPPPLQYSWTIWFDKYSNTTDYESRLYVLQEDVASIKTFYQVYNNYPWDRIAMRDSVHIFRKGIKPVWEDPENLKGGCWRFRVPKAKAQDFFHEIAILCLASEFEVAMEEQNDHVLGVSISVRFNSNIISIWNKLGSNENSIKILGETIINRLSPHLRPTEGPAPNVYFYRRHDENEGYKEAVEALAAIQEEE